MLKLPFSEEHLYSIEHKYSKFSLSFSFLCTSNHEGFLNLTFAAFLRIQLPSIHMKFNAPIPLSTEDLKIIILPFTIVY